MKAIAFELLILLLLVCINGFFAMVEIAVLSCRKARLQAQIKHSSSGAEAVLRLLKDPGAFLATIQIGITLVGIMTGVFGGATIARELSLLLKGIPCIKEYSEGIGVTCTVLFITYLSLVLGELVPKRLAIHNPERIATALVKPVHLLSRIASPFVWILRVSTDVLLHPFHIRVPTGPDVTGEEIRILLEQARKAGTVEENEQDMIERIFRLTDQQIGRLQSHRTQLVALDIADPHEINLYKVKNSAHSHFPVYDTHIDNVLGVVSLSDLCSAGMNCGPVSLRDLLRDPLIVPQSLHVTEAIELFKNSGQHLLLVIDEHGGLSGLITPTDILEAIIGDIPAPGVVQEPQAIRRDDGSWLMDGMIDFEDFKALIGFNRVLSEKRGHYHTLGGFIMHQLGHIPGEGEHFEWEGVRIEIVDMDGNRVDKVLIIPLRV